MKAIKYLSYLFITVILAFPSYSRPVRGPQGPQAEGPNRQPRPNRRPPNNGGPNRPNHRPPNNGGPNRPDFRPPNNGGPNRPDHRPPNHGHPDRPHHRPPHGGRPDHPHHGHRPHPRPPVYYPPVYRPPAYYPPSYRPPYYYYGWDNNYNYRYNYFYGRPNYYNSLWAPQFAPLLFTAAVPKSFFDAFFKESYLTELNRKLKYLLNSYETGPEYIIYLDSPLGDGTIFALSTIREWETENGFTCKDVQLLAPKLGQDIVVIETYCYNQATGWYHLKMQ